VLHHYAYGKPKETLDVDVKEQLKPANEMTDEELETVLLQAADEIRAKRQARTCTTSRPLCDARFD
jgi:hypothetical protein